MNSNGTNILETMASSVFSCNYLSNYSLPLVVIILLLLLITVKLCTPHRFGSLTAASVNHVQTTVRPPPVWPKTHQPSVYTDPQMFYNDNLHETVVDAPPSISTCTSSISLPAQSQNTINATENVPLLSKQSQHVIECMISYQEQLESGGCGLENFGNSCYVNSALQCLCHIRPFIDIILNLQQQQQQQLPPVTSAYAQLLTEMQSIPKGATSAYQLKARISDVNRRFAGTDQQDSHEFLTILLEILHDELMDNYQNSSIGDLMHGVIRSTVKCLACPEETITDDSFLSLPLPVRRSAAETFDSKIRENICEKFIGIFISRSASDPDIHGSFQAFLSPEQLGENGQWFCENCQNLTDATKRFDLWQLPRVLILQLKRFTCDLTNDTKIATKIRFDLQLNLSEFMKECEHDSAPLYNLVAVLTHSGTLASGHYMTFAKHLDDEVWYHFDDQHVRQASSNEVLSSDAYILVYERKYSHTSS